MMYTAHQASAQGEGGLVLEVVAHLDVSSACAASRNSLRQHPLGFSGPSRMISPLEVAMVDLMEEGSRNQSWW